MSNSAGGTMRLASVWGSGWTPILCQQRASLERQRRTMPLAGEIVVRGHRTAEVVGENLAYVNSICKPVSSLLDSSGLPAKILSVGIRI